MTNSAAPRRQQRPVIAAEICLLETRTLLAGSAPTVNDATFTINENLAHGTAVGTVIASDPDVGDTLSYAITAGNTGGAFAINSGTGEITVDNAAAVDFETNPTFSLTVEVTDSSVPNLIDTATITVNLNNVNEPPRVVLGSPVVAIDENSSTSIPLIVTSVTVTDDALGSETLTLSGPDAEVFQIVGSTLRVRAGTVLDYETQSSYSVTVNVDDASIPGSPDDSQTFTLNLNNVGEPPVIVGGQQFQISPTSGNGTVVGTLDAFDPDGGPLQYAIINDTLGGMFQMNSTTGVITLANNAALTTRYYGLTVRVKDNNNLAVNGSVSILVNTTPVISGGVSNQPVVDTGIISPFTSIVITDPDTQPMSVRVEVPNFHLGDFTPASVVGWTRSNTSSKAYYIRSFNAAPNIGATVQAAVRNLVFQPTPDELQDGASITMTFPLFVNDGLEATVVDNSVSVRITNENTPVTIGGAVANQAVNDNATIAPFSTLTVTDPDRQAMTALVQINNGVVRGDFTPASAAGWTRSTVGNVIRYTRSFSATADIGSVATAAIQALVFQPRANAIKPNTTEATNFTVTIFDGGTPATDSTTSVLATSINDAPVFGGLNANLPVNDNATVNPFVGLTVTDADTQEMLISVTILNGVVRGDFTNATSSGWATRQVIGNNITYKRYFSPGPNVGATVQAAFRALTFQPRTNAITPETTEATDFQVTISDGVAPAVAGTGTRVTTTSVNQQPAIAGTVANQMINDDQTAAVFSSVTITDPDMQALFAQVHIPYGGSRGDLTAASTIGWTRKVSGSTITYERFFPATTNNAALVQAALRGLVFQPRNNVPVGTTETTNISLVVRDTFIIRGDNTTSVITTGVAPFIAALALPSEGKPSRRGLSDLVS